MKTLQQSYKPSVENLEERTVPAMVYGWHNGTYAWFDNGIPNQDIQQINSNIPVLPSIKATSQTPVENADGTISVKIQIAAIQGDVNPNLGFGMIASLPQNTVVSNVTQQHLVATQVNNNTQLNIAYAAIQPNEVFSTAEFTLTFTPVAGNEPTFVFQYLSPFTTSMVDNSALDAFYSSHF